jgi:serine/threonine-protein kinase
LHEARLAASLSSPYSVRVFDVGQLDDTTPYIVMEYLEGRTLRQYLREHGPVAVHLALDWALQICSALKEAHAVGLVHRDINPSNLFLVGRPGLDIHVKLVDFGLAKNVLSPQVDLFTDSGVLMGSPAYVAPERLRAGVTTAQSDVWSLGVVLFEMLSGVLPFDAPTSAGMLAAIAADPPRPLRSVAPQLPVQLEAVTARCLRKRAEDRFPSVEDVALAVRRARRSAPAPESQRTPLLATDTEPPPVRRAAPRSADTDPPPVKPAASRRRKRWLTWIPVVLVLAFGLLFGAALRHRHESSSDRAGPDEREPSEIRLMAEPSSRGD